MAMDQAPDATDDHTADAPVTRVTELVIVTRVMPVTGIRRIGNAEGTGGPSRLSGPGSTARR